MGSRFDDEVIVGAGAYIELVRCFVNWSEFSSDYSKQHLRLIYNSFVDNWCTLSFDNRLGEIQKHLLRIINNKILKEVSEGIIYTKDLSLTSCIFKLDYLDLILNHFFLSSSPPFSLGSSELEIYSDSDKEVKVRMTMDGPLKKDRKTIQNKDRWIKNSLCVLCNGNIELLRIISLLNKDFYSLKVRKGENIEKISCVRVPMFTKENFPGVKKEDGLISEYAYIPIFSSKPLEDMKFLSSKGVLSATPIDDFYII